MAVVASCAAGGGLEIAARVPCDERVGRRPVGCRGRWLGRRTGLVWRGVELGGGYRTLAGARDCARGGVCPLPVRPDLRAITSTTSSKGACGVAARWLRHPCLRPPRRSVALRPHWKGTDTTHQARRSISRSRPVAAEEHPLAAGADLLKGARVRTGSLAVYRGSTDPDGPGAVTGTRAAATCQRHSQLPVSGLPRLYRSGTVDERGPFCRPGHGRRRAPGRRRARRGQCTVSEARTQTARPVAMRSSASSAVPAEQMTTGRPVPSLSSWRTGSSQTSAGARVPS